MLNEELKQKLRRTARNNEYAMLQEKQKEYQKRMDEIQQELKIKYDFEEETRFVDEVVSSFTKA